MLIQQLVRRRTGWKVLTESVSYKYRGGDIKTQVWSDTRWTGGEVEGGVRRQGGREGEREGGTGGSEMEQKQ